MTRNTEERLTRKRTSRDEHGKSLTPEQMLGADVVAQRKRLVAQRARWHNSVLPDIPPEVLGPQWHPCWVSTTSKSDNVSTRQALGYVIVKPEEMPENFQLGRMSSGKTEGSVMVNEMILMKIDQAAYQADRSIQTEEALSMQNDIVDRMRGIADAAGTPYGTALEGGEIDGIEELAARKQAKNVFYE